MKIKVPSKTVEVCDRCRGERSAGLLTKCVACGREYCGTCEAIICGCIHQPDICQDCGETEEVRAVVMRYAPRLRAMLKQRDAAMRKAYDRQRGASKP